MQKISYDGPVVIATGKSRQEKSWRNKNLLWSDLVKLLSTTHRTPETHAEYMAATPARQDEIKDIGGFVGGYINGGRRKRGSVPYRQLVTLDIDYGKPGTWEDFLLVYGCAACVYSTHKHTPAAPRLRIVLPLDREILPDEYEPICRRIAGDIGIEAFADATTYQDTRLMYWPSTSKDGVFLFDLQDGPWLSADEVLGRYTDWRDSSSWPMAASEKDKVRSDIKKQEDPLEKPGIIGAWCRTYTIPEVIEKYLGDVYEVTDMEDRYTYSAGSTAAGLVVYDDKFAFSHHGTDPASGKLCNAFDLVRLHKFGHLDEGTGDTKASTVAMQEYGAKDKEVLKQLGIERLQAARDDFQLQAGLEPGEKLEDEQTEEPVDDAGEWMKELDTDRKGNYVSSIDNIYRVLRNDPRLKGRLYFDEFENWLMVKGHLPWRVVRKGSQFFTDDDTDCLAHYLECYRMPFAYLPRALSLIRNDYKIHPVRDYLNRLNWDGVERLDALLIDYLGVEDSAYTRAVTRKTFVAAVARIMEPGIKFDNMLTLIGPEGHNKSSIIKKMFGQWFSDCLGDIHSTKGMESLRGVWGMEVAELSAFRKVDQEAIKRFTASQEDVYRPAYGRQQVRFPRQTIFIPTSNKLDFLVNGHDHRRFWPVLTDLPIATKNIWQDLTADEINQVWAEALTYYQAGESLILDTRTNDAARAARERHTELDERAGMIRQFLEIKLPADWEDKNILERSQFIRCRFSDEDFGEDSREGTVDRKHVCAAEIWCELMEKRPGDMNNSNTKYIHDIMKKMKGWRQGEKTRRFGIYGPQRYYEKL